MTDPIVSTIDTIIVSGSPAAVTANTTDTATPTANVTITGAALNAPRGLAFDPSGNLWVANYNSTTVVEYTPSQLAATGTPTPNITIGGLNSPTALAFDNSADLWVDEANTGSSVLELTAANIAASGSPTASVTISPSVPTSIMFDPPATNLPLAGASVVRYAPSVAITTNHRPSLRR